MVIIILLATCVIFVGITATIKINYDSQTKLMPIQITIMAVINLNPKNVAIAKKNHMTLYLIVNLCKSYGGLMLSHSSHLKSSSFSP